MSKQSMALAYAVRRRVKEKRMAQGGRVMTPSSETDSPDDEIELLDDDLDEPPESGDDPKEKTKQRIEAIMKLVGQRHVASKS